MGGIYHVKVIARDAQLKCSCETDLPRRLVAGCGQSYANYGIRCIKTTHQESMQMSDNLNAGLDIHWNPKIEVINRKSFVTFFLIERNVHIFVCRDIERLAVYQNIFQLPYYVYFVKRVGTVPYEDSSNNRQATSRWMKLFCM